MSEFYSPQCVRLSVGSRRQQEDSSWHSSCRLWDTIDAKGSQKPVHTLCNPSQKWMHTTIQVSGDWMLLTCMQIRVTTLTGVFFVTLLFILSLWKCECYFIGFWCNQCNVALHFQSDFLEADKVTVLARSLKAANLSLPISHNLTNHDNIPLKVASPKHKLHVISNKEFNCDSFS